MKKSIDVLTIGDLCADLVLNGKDVVPEFGQKEKLVENYVLEMGGSTPIFACQTAKLGLKTVLIGKVGEDAFGDMIRDTMKKSGVDVRYVKKDPSQKSGLTVMMNTGKDRAMLTYLGHIDGVTRQDIPDHLLKSTRHFHIGSFYLTRKVRSYYPAMVEKLKKFGATISLDTNWDPEEKWDSGLWELFPYLDIFMPNENEALNISGEKSVDRAGEKLQNYVPIVVIKMGERGAKAFSKGKKYQAEALKVKVVDTVGAGDSFNGGFVWGFLRGKSIAECLKAGCICGSLNVTSSGGTKAQPYLKDLNRYLNSNISD